MVKKKLGNPISRYVYEWFMIGIGIIKHEFIQTMYEERFWRTFLLPFTNDWHWHDKSKIMNNELFGMISPVWILPENDM